MFRSRIFDERRDPFGRLEKEEDDEFFKIRSAPFAHSEKMLTTLGDSVGRNQTNSRRDVAKIETLMTRENQFDTSRTDGPTGIFSLPLENAIKNFQEIKGLKKDGLITPNGETIGSLTRLNIEQFDGEDEGGDEEDGEDVPKPDRKPHPPAPKEPDGDEDKEKPPIPPKKPEPPNPDKDKPESECSELEAALEVAESILEEKNGALETAEAGADTLEGKLSSLEAEIEEKSAHLDKSRTGARAVGIGGGAIAGALGGAVFGKSLPAGIAGAAVGGDRGLAIADAAMQAVEAQIVVLEAQRESVLAELEPIRASIEALQAEASQAQGNVDQSKSALEACQSNE